MSRSVLDPLDRQRMQRDVEHLHGLGARAGFELLVEIAEELDGLAEIQRRLGAYRRLTPAMVRVVGADRFPPAPLWLVQR